MPSNNTWTIGAETGVALEIVYLDGSKARGTLNPSAGSLTECLQAILARPDVTSVRVATQPAAKTVLVN